MDAFSSPLNDGAFDDDADDELTATIAFVVFAAFFLGSVSCCLLAIATLFPFFTIFGR